MKKILILVVLLWGCSNHDDYLLNFPNTGLDAFNDVTHLQGFFYTTNYDLSEGSGPRIFLYTLDPTGHLINKAPLEMNSQGYIALTSDGQSIYGLCSTIPGLVMQWNTVGERLSQKVYDWPEHWTPGGIVYDQSDSTLKFITSMATDSGRISRVWTTVDSTSILRNLRVQLQMNGTRPIAATFGPTNNLFVLAEDSTHNRIVRQFNHYSFQSEYDLHDTLTNGITWVDTSLVCITKDRDFFPIPNFVWASTP